MRATASVSPLTGNKENGPFPHRGHVPGFRGRATVRTGNEMEPVRAPALKYLYSLGPGQVAGIQPVGAPHML